MRRDYFEAFEALRHVYLEDSWVLHVYASPAAVALILDVVLTEEHPDYLGARPGEHYDYRPAELLIMSEQVLVTLSGLPPAVDAAGVTDLGHIDSWCVEDDQWSVLEGDWGTARVLSACVRLTLGPRT